MEIQRWFRLAAVLLALGVSFAACGTDDDDPHRGADVSGGEDEDVGDDVDNDVDDVDEDAEDAEDTTDDVTPPAEYGYFRVVNASNMADSFDLWINGLRSNVVQLEYGQSSGAFIRVPTGTYSFDLTEAGAEDTSDAVLSETLTVEQDVYYTAWAYGAARGEDDDSFGIALEAEELREAVDGEVDLRFGHALYGVGPATILPSESDEPLFSDVGFGEYAGPVTVNAEAHSFSLDFENDEGIESFLFNADLSAASGMVQLFAIGERQTAEQTELLAVLFNGTVLRLQPDVPDLPEDDAVWRFFNASQDLDAAALWADDALLASGIGRGLSSGAFESLEPGDYTFKVTSSADLESDTLAELELSIYSDLNHTFYIAGSVDGDAPTEAELELHVFAYGEDAMEDDVGLALTNAAFEAGALFLSIKLYDESDFGFDETDYSDVQPGESVGFLELPQDDYLLGASPMVAELYTYFMTELSEASGMVHVFFFGEGIESASQAEGALTALALLEDGSVVELGRLTPPPAGFGSWRFFQGSHDLPEAALWLDGERVAGELGFGDSNGAWSELEAGTHTLRVTTTSAEDDSEFLVELNFSLVADESYTFYTYGAFDLRENFPEEFGLAYDTVSLEETPNGLPFVATQVAGQVESAALFMEQSLPELWSESATPAFSGMALGDTQETFYSAAMEYYLGVAPYNEEPRQYFFADFSNAEGLIHLFIAGDFNAGEERGSQLQVFALYDSGAVAQFEEYYIETEAGPPAQVRFFNAYNGSYDASLWVGEETHVGTVFYGESSGSYIMLDAGVYTFRVVTEGHSTDDPFLVEEVMLEEGQSYTFYLYGSSNDSIPTEYQPQLKLFSYPTYVASASPHIGATNAFVGSNSISVETSSMMPDGGGSNVLFGSIYDGESYPPIELASGDYMMEVTTLLDNSAIYFHAPFEAVTGYTHIFYVADLTDLLPASEIGRAFALHEDGSVEELMRLHRPAQGQWRVFHSMTGVGNVDIYVDGELAVSDLEYGQSSGGFLPIDEGEHYFEAVPHGEEQEYSDYLVTSFPASYGESTTVYLHGYYDLEQDSDQMAGIDYFMDYDQDMWGAAPFLVGVNAASDLYYVELALSPSDEPPLQMWYHGDHARSEQLEPAVYSVALTNSGGDSPTKLFELDLTDREGAVSLFVAGDTYYDMADVEVYVLYLDGSVELLESQPNASLRVFNAINYDGNLQLWMDDEPFGMPFGTGELLQFAPDEYRYAYEAAFSGRQFKVADPDADDDEFIGEMEFMLDMAGDVLLVVGGVYDPYDSDSTQFTYSLGSAPEPLTGPGAESMVQVSAFHAIANAYEPVKLQTEAWDYEYISVWFDIYSTYLPSLSYGDHLIHIYHQDFLDAYNLVLGIPEGASDFSLVFGGEVLPGTSEPLRIFGVYEDNSVEEFAYSVYVLPLALDN